MLRNKRFSIWDCNAMENLLNTFVHDSEKNGQDNTLLTHKECCDLLNELNDENEQLKKEIKRLKYHLNETEKELQEYKDFMSLG